MSATHEEGTSPERLQPPHRRLVLTLELNADSWEDAIQALESLVLDLELGHCRMGSVSGGYSSGYLLRVQEDPEITHERYMEAVHAYVAQLRG